MIFAATPRHLFTISSGTGCHTCFHSLIPIGVSAAGLAIVSLPYLLIADGRPLAISLGNLDLADLACASRFLQEFARNSKQGFLGQSGFFQWISDDVWFGPSAIVAFISTLLGSAPYKLQSLVMNVVATQGAALLYILISEVLSFRKLPAITVCILYSVSPILMYTTWESFGGQIISIPLTLGILLAAGLVLKNRVTWKQAGPYLFLLIILESGLLDTYHYILLINIALIGCYAAAYFFLARFDKRYILSFSVLATSVAITCALNPLRVRGLVSMLSVLKDAVAGWFIPWIGPGLLFGFNASAKLVGIKPQLPNLLVFLFVGLILIVNLSYLIRCWKTENHHLAFFLGLVIPIFALALYFSLPSASNPNFGGYRGYKIASAFFGFYLSGNLLFVTKLAVTPVRRLVFAIIFLPILFFAGYNTWNLITFMRVNAYVLPKNVIALENLENYQFVPGINVLSTDNNTSIWINYFLLKKPQIYQTFPYGGRVIGKFDPDYYFLAENANLPSLHNRYDIFSVSLTQYTDRYQIDPVFYIYRASPQQTLLISPGKGWWNSEGTHRWSGRDGSSVSLILQAQVPDISVYVTAKYSPLEPGDHMRADYEGKSLVLHESIGEFSSEQFLLHKGDNIITFSNTLPPGKPTAWDPRTLGILWTDVTVKILPKK